MYDYMYSRYGMVLFGWLGVHCIVIAREKSWVKRSTEGSSSADGSSFIGIVGDCVKREFLSK